MRQADKYRSLEFQGEVRVRFRSQISVTCFMGLNKVTYDSAWIFKRPAAPGQNHGKCQHLDVNREEKRGS